jgi:hypothetical protein
MTPEGIVTETDAPSTPEELAAALDEQVADAANAIADEVKILEGYIETARTYAPEMDIAVAFARAFPPADPSYLARMRTTVGVGPHVLNGVLVMWDARRLADVTARVAWLAQRLGKFAIEDAPEMGRRTYVWDRFKFCVFFNSYDAKTVCKFVEVGKEERPIYKLMCEEAAS